MGVVVAAPPYGNNREVNSIQARRQKMIYFFISALLIIQCSRGKK
jgi:hypothetical protein